MADATLQWYAAAAYGIALDVGQVEALSRAWFALFPEMERFLDDGDRLGRQLAAMFGLTPASHQEHTGSNRFTWHPGNLGREHLPHPILGLMLLKVLKEPDPTTRDGRPYPAAEIDYFWYCLTQRVDLLPEAHHAAVRDRQPSVSLQRAVMNAAGAAPVFVVTGRLRAAASYCARHNTIFQGLAADGAKLALWNLWRAGYRIANFIHDQVLVEVPADSNLAEQATRIRDLMIAGVREVVPDVKVGVSFAATDRWHKKAEAVYDENGKLLLWHPDDVAPRAA
jgi:hypothetical protein